LQGPFSNENLPYWAFCWSGGQAVSRFLIDNPKIVRNKNVLDLGAGGGIGTLAAKIGGAKRIVVNDIDKIALVSSYLNVLLNFPSIRKSSIQQNQSNQNVAYIKDDVDNSEIIFSESNFLKRENSEKRSEEQKFDVIIVGDLFYDSSFASELLEWLFFQKTKNNSMILIGDPLRANFKEREKFKVTISYSKPQNQHSSELEDHHLANVFVYTI